VGEILLWKNPQKNDTKKNTSDEMNRIIPIFSPFITRKECAPWAEASRWMSRHHRNPMVNINSVDRVNKIRVFLFSKISRENTKVSIPLDARIGQGLLSTR